jgi:hypothetical protein
MQGNMTGAIGHYRAALDLEPGYPAGLDQLRIPACYVKFHALATRAEEGRAAGDSSCRSPSPSSLPSCSLFSVLFPPCFHLR